MLIAYRLIIKHTYLSFVCFFTKVVTGELRKYATEAIRLEGLVLKLSCDNETKELSAHLAGVRTRIATLLSQAENGRIVVSVSSGSSINHQLLLIRIQSGLKHKNCELILMGSFVNLRFYHGKFCITIVETNG